MRSYVTSWTTGGAVPVAVVSDPKSTAGGASPYSMSVLSLMSVIDQSCLRSGLLRAVETGGLRDVAPDDDRPDQASALVVADVGAEPVVTRAVEGDGHGSARVVRQPHPLAVAVARHERAVRVLVVVDELDVQVPAVGQDEDRGVPDQLVGHDPDPGAHPAVVPLLGLPEVAGGQQPADRRLVLPVQPELVQSPGSLRCGGRHRPSLLVRCVLWERTDGVPAVPAAVTARPPDDVPPSRARSAPGWPWHLLPSGCCRPHGDQA